MFANATHGITWTVSDASGVAFTSGCELVTPHLTRPCPANSASRTVSLSPADTPPSQPRFVPVISVAVAQAATLPMVVAGVSLLLRAGGGLYWLVPGVAFSLVVAVVNAWVLLVEVVR